MLRTGHYTKNIAAALEENKTEMSGMILETIKNDPQTKRVKYIPFHDEIIQLIVDTTFRMVLQVLADERTDELVADVLRENIDQIRDTVNAVAEELAAIKRRAFHAILDEEGERLPQGQALIA